MVEINFFAALLSTVLLSLVTVAIIRPQETYKYFQRKRYRYDVTLALYMLTPTECFIFNSILFLTLTLLTIAACLYLPDHVSTITRRVYYYCFGDNGLAGAAAATALKNASVIAESVATAASRKTSGEMAREMLNVH
ncbi:uncharacterized protein PV09_09176 [Verruconis gallopava]|uniref:Uncharacterized protein n=1 Tax=Verruconis gallopava TaxID=253628 RepID=A0A0D1YEJ9_9PEZI|nr:uncharacterized protein PV09_09176 [Verruconis gallopava]KIV99146.1 hypothetical protein PV09_09176 [Verruconis gallopava]